MGTVTLKINGNEVTAKKGTMVLQAARDAGADIPTMCNHEELEPFGACRLCVVEIVRGGRSRVVASCLYPVEEGIDVLTETDKIRQFRKIILELMAARWPLIDKKLLERYEVRTDRMVEKPNFCIMCGLCVRQCNENNKSHVLSFVGRGTNRQVVSYPAQAKVKCPECFDTERGCYAKCPTGVIVNDSAVECHLSRMDEAFARPVRVRNDDNAHEVSKLVGDEK